MQEHEIYPPTTPVEAAKIQGIKDSLVKAFGGYTLLNHRTEGAWRKGGVTFHDEVTIVRVLDDGSAHFDMTAFKKIHRDCAPAGGGAHHQPAGRCFVRCRRKSKSKSKDGS